MATIYNMLSAYKDSTDKDNLVFWASNALNQNDTEELSLELDNILEVICELESKGEELSDIYKLSTFKNYTWIPEITGQIQKNLEELLKTKEFIPYTISFSNAEDKLIMWSMYANNGNGICLAFDEQTLVNQKRDLKVVSGNVVYQKTSDTFKKEIKEIVDMFHDEV